MESIIISSEKKEDLKLVEQVAKKMGMQTKAVTPKKGKKKTIDEITLMSEPALAEDWLSEEDNVYNDL